MAIHHSTLAALKQCPQKFKYAYIEKLERRREARPLKQGSWLHFMLAVDALRRGLEYASLLEVPETIDAPDVGEVTVGVHRCHPRVLKFKDAHGGVTSYPLTWYGALDLLTDHAWNWLPGEYQEHYANEKGASLPEVCRTIMRGYLYRWKGVLEKERPLLVEVSWERTDLSGPEPVEYGGRVDEVLVDAEGRVIVRDWKTTTNAPSGNYRLRERQRLLYAWGIEPILASHGLKVSGLELDYLITRPPPKPVQNKDGSLSKRKINTTPVVYLEALREYGIELTEEHKEKVRDMKRGEAFYPRFPMPLNQKQIVRMLGENAAVAALAKQYQQLPQLVYRVESRACDYMCEFSDICLAESLGQDASTIKSREFRVRQALVEEEDHDAEEEA
jgi:hypothetical protein